MNQNTLNKFLTPETCEAAGIVVSNVTDESIYIGAMNPDYSKVKEVIKKIESEYRLKVEVNQITTKEWEQSFQDQVLQSVESNKLNSHNNFNEPVANLASKINNFKSDSFVSNDTENLNGSNKGDSEALGTFSNIKELNSRSPEQSNTQESEDIPENLASEGNQDDDDDDDDDDDRGSGINVLAYQA